MAKRLSRRTFGTVVGAAAIGATQASRLDVSRRRRPAEASAAAADASRTRTFPAGFLWGSATAAYQVEGAATEDGRGPSVWDTFSHTPGKTNAGATGDVADDHYHRYKEDVELMKALVVKTYRFSISWSRLFPQGAVRPNPKGIELYRHRV